MKKLFQAIRKHDFETVKELIEAKPELVNCVAKQSPKSDDGQSPLQVALKTGGLTISEYLLDHGADVNFMESKDCCNAWRAPVIHDAINAAVMCSRYNTRDYDSGKYIVENDKKLAERALRILERMIAMGADVNAADSYGNTCLWRFCLQAAQILPSYDYQNKAELTDRKFTKEVADDLSKIVKVLRRAGMDMKAPDRHTGKTAIEYYKGQSIVKILK